MHAAHTPPFQPRPVLPFLPRPVAVELRALRFGHCEMRLDTRELRLHGLLHPVRRRVFDLIVYLARHQPRAVPHAELLRAVWQRTTSSPSLLARAVTEARRAVGDVGEHPRFILSVHGVGYRFATGADELPCGDGMPPELEDARVQLAALQRACAELQGRLARLEAAAHGSASVYTGPAGL